MLELAVLGLLHEAPMHGYQLRKQLHARLGTFRAFSWGSLYPTLRRLQRAGLIAETSNDAGSEATEEGAEPAGTTRARGSWGRRGRRVYELTADGKEHLAQILASSGPTTWEDEHFDVRFAFFAQTDAETRLRILEGRRTRLTERLENVRQSAVRTRERLDEYTLELQRHGLEQVEREVRWLDGLIDNERGTRRGTTEGDGRPAGPDTADGAPAPRH